MSWNNTPPPSYSAPAPPGTGNSGSLYSFTSPPTHDSPPIYSANTTTSSLYSSNPQSSLYTQPASSSSLYTSSGPTSPLYSSGSNSSLLPPTGNPTLRGKTSPQPTVRLQRPGTGIPPPTEAAPHPPNGGTGQGPYRSISGPNRGGPGPNRGGPPTHGTPNKPLPKPPGSLDPDSVSAPVISLEKDELPISQQTPDKNRFRSNWAPPVPSPRHSYIGAPGAVSAPHLDETADSSEDEEEEEEEEFSDESDSHSQQSTTSSTASNKSGLLKFSRANKKTPAYLLASGPPRVCDGCMALIYCSEIPFPDGKKPKSKKLKQLTAQESQKAKLKKEQEKEKKKLIKEQTREIKKAEKEKKKSTSDLHSEPEASYEPAAVPNHDDLPPPTKEELEEVTIDDLIEMQISDKINQEIAERDNLKVELAACEDINSPEYAKLKEALEEKEYVIKALFSTLGMENQSTEFNPLLRRKDYRKRKRNITIVRSTVLTGGAMSISAVGGAVVGGVTGFLFGFGVPGAIAGAAIGAGIGGAGGAVVGGYASRQAATQRPKHCLNCRVVMKKNKPGRMPYKCRSCWMWYCDRCVPHELVLENETIHTIIYKDDSDTVTRYDPSEVHEEVPFASEYQRSARQGSKSVLKKRKSSLFSSSKPTSADEVSKAVPEREAWCSWCFKKTIHLFVSKGHITRNVWQCEHCLNRTLKCRNPACEEMARGLLGYDEEACWKCQRKIHSWEDGSLENDAKVKNSYCSWCFDFTQHEPMCHTSVIRIYKCRACRNTTVPCSSCPRGDGWGMARDNGFFWKGKCALHAKHIETWEDPQHNRDISEIRGVWCPWCMELSTHVVMGPGGLLNRKTAFLCKNCHQRTYKCSDSECNFAMAIHARRKCLPCKIKQKQEKNPNEIIPSFDELLEKKNTVYEDLSSLAIRKRDLRRESAHEERQNATKEGYLRPFLLLVSMEPPMRVLTAATLGIDLIRRPIFGDSHAEAWLIISHHNKGLIFRTRVASEEVTKLATGTKATWYTTLRRAMRATMKSTTFKHINAKISKDACMNPDINILPEMELEFLEKLAHWQHMMISPEVAAVADDVMKNPELDQRMAVLDRYGLATPVIKRLLAEMFAESTFATETDMLSQFLAENEKQETPGRKLDDDQISVSTTTTISTMKTSVHGSNSTYSKKSKVVSYTAAAIPAAYVKLTVWFLVGSALAFWLGPVGWAIEWGASLALGAVITAWVAGELYLGPSHEAMTPAVVLICMQRLTLAGEEVDITEFMDKVPPKYERRNSVHKK